jgi:hypothetical protein
MTKTKKRLLLLASLPLTIAVTIGVLAMLPPRPVITKGNFDRIQEGMTKAQVEEIFGREGFISNYSGTDHRIWVADDRSQAVIFFSDDGVTDKDWEDSNETFLDKIRRVLHLQ